MENFISHLKNTWNYQYILSNHSYIHINIRISVMRTYEDVIEALKTYENELTRESGIRRDHYIIVGGSINLVRKGVGEYVLEKGTPTPMVWETAKKKLTEFQAKCGDNIRLEIINYSDWLLKNIEDCKKLIKCMDESLSGQGQRKLPPETNDKEAKPGPVESGPLCTQTTKTDSEDPGNNRRAVAVSCLTCPYNISTCMICRFATGINMDVFPWEIICTAPDPPIP